MTSLPHTTSRSLGLFLTVQCLLALTVVAAWWRSSLQASITSDSAVTAVSVPRGLRLGTPSEVRRRRAPTLANEPTSVEPRHDIPEIVSDQQLARILFKLRPRFRHGSPKINHVDHALRCWGAEVSFADPQFVSGDEMRRLLTDMVDLRRTVPKARP